MSNNFEKSIGLEISNNNKKEIRLANTMDNDNKNSRPVDIDK